MLIVSTSSKSVREDDEDEEDNLYDETEIQWSDLIFLPFNPIFRLAVILSVIHKTILGPLDACLALTSCSDAMDYNILTMSCKIFYDLIGFGIYFLDTFLHIVHRQVTDKAVRREHLPKSALLILLDILSLIPFDKLLSQNVCKITVWPNILGFLEFATIYRLVEYFELKNTHKTWKQYIGLTLIILLSVNCLTCLLLLLTFHGLCKSCDTRSTYFYDWRQYTIGMKENVSKHFLWYFYGYQYIFSIMIDFVFVETKASTLVEHIICCFLMFLGEAFELLLILPKLFCEAVLSLRWIYTFHPRVAKLIDETRRRNPTSDSYHSLKSFYDLMWTKRAGIINTPPILNELPRYLKVEIRQDMVWPVFYHSPTLRDASTPFKRYLCEVIRVDYKLPGTRFFAGPHCNTHLYYIKSGVVQLISVDDGSTALLSVSGGTLFGDISFYTPPLKRKIIVKCLTYCEVLYISRVDLLRSLHRYPDDRKNIYLVAQDKLRHAKMLYNCKNNVKGIDRAEDEGMDWIKRRWWEISDCIDLHKRKGRKADKIEIPVEETMHHCAKYLGQLVLCNDAQLKKTSLFVNDTFPWVLTPNSAFGRMWNNFVYAIVLLVLLTFPPNLTQIPIESWFLTMKFFTDFVYIADICVSLCTSVGTKENETSHFASVMLVRFKKPTFVLDVLSALWIENIALMVGKPEFYYPAQFNRLIKIYRLFAPEGTNWTAGQDHTFHVYLRIFLCSFCFMYITAYVLFLLIRFVPSLSVIYFFGKSQGVCEDPKMSIRDCILTSLRNVHVVISFIFEYLYPEVPHTSIINIFVMMIISYHSFLLGAYCKARFIAATYLKYRSQLNYQRFVTTLRKYYKHLKIHRSLMVRLEKYLHCHYKYYHGVDVLNSNALKDEPFDVFWKVQGEITEKIIGESEAFVGADPSLVKELAYIAKFLILPQTATLFLFGIECHKLTWIVQGHVKCEYLSDDGEIVKRFYGPGDMISVAPILLKRPSIRTYIAYTDCEILYVKDTDFNSVMKRYQHEWNYLCSAIHDFTPKFDKIYQNYVPKHADYQRKVRERINEGNPFSNTILAARSKVRRSRAKYNETYASSEIYLHPESNFMKFWMPFRAITVVFDISTRSFVGGGGVQYKRQLTILKTFWDAISFTNIVLKLFLAYYDDRGILVTAKKKTVANYIVRGFTFDVIGFLPWDKILPLLLSRDIPEGFLKLVNTVAGFALIYSMTGYFDYLADRPSAISVLIKFIKWQIVTLLLMITGCHFLVNWCVDFTFDGNNELLNMTRLDACWMPPYIELSKYPSMKELQLIFAQSMNFAQVSLLSTGIFLFQARNNNNVVVPFVLFVMGLIYWFIVAYSLTIIVLISRSDTIFQHAVRQLSHFLKAERIEKQVIKRTIAHFSYWWLRTKGINVHTLMFDRMGIVFRQDLSFYFFKTTYRALDTLLEGGEQFQRQMSSLSNQVYYLPNEEIIRELDLTSQVFVIHRGKVIISQGGDKLAVLSKGAIFGQLSGSTPRPIKISAVADQHVDILEMSTKHFEESLNDEIKERIAKNPQSKKDYLATKKTHLEDPYNTVRYILRGRKTIKLPFMKIAMEARTRNLYSKWLFLAWLLGPAATAYMLAALVTLPDETATFFMWFFLIFDVIHLAHTVSEFYTVNVVVEHGRCVNRRIGFKLLKEWRLYINVVSLIVPVFTLIFGDRIYQFARLARLVLFCDFYGHFCKSFKNTFAPVLLKLIIFTLIIHAMTCGWIYVACQDEHFPVPIPYMPLEYRKTIDADEWIKAGERLGGCARISRHFINANGTDQISFIIPRHWYNDYIIALTFIFILHTGTSLDYVVLLNLPQIYYKIFINIIINVIDIWLMSAAVGFVYTLIRELYQYDFNVKTLNIYLQHSGLSPALIHTVVEYTKHLWNRQAGNWLPELALQAPDCLREDILGALYLHHILTPPLFRQLPDYFTRQLVARVGRVVIFPGKTIVQEGDIYPIIYFVHEGEVEKWYNMPSPDKKLASLLTTNGYFGLLPGLFPNTRFQFTYVARTVVDLVYLRLKDWIDLLNAYPDVKLNLYESARMLRSKETRER